MLIAMAAAFQITSEPIRIETREFPESSELA